VAAALAASGCGGSTTTVINKTVTQAQTSTASTTSDPTKVFMMNLGSQRFVAPSDFSFSVDGDFVGENLNWTNWGDPTTIGTGTISERDYPSNRRVKFPGTIKLTGLQACKGAQYYTHATAPVPSSAPFKPDLSHSLAIPCG
jgi:hypothetical protein